MSADASSTSSRPAITVLYFAAASTETGLTSERVPLPASYGLPLSALADVLTARHPGTHLGEVLAQSQWAVDEEMVEDPAQVVLKGGEEVAVICPVSGG
ncbi:uncharacterized protein TRAVEDRAFT_125659 [Trametes versicolor FP-101664 SS1]|uniref:uncharacterized protein n=1 Tax=Trametes versicolor (strain FP-101664) TaxID=717944 RepID=UPI00046236C7|nr:uncharacterized protein TRAVEDRAFT_125659 [Trametes versicolor FP-101664 SS1]EIW57309.1 hypothetical protein TRAVEDRAFT_125659 [Trametes versicolor FP-101664 SS1]